MVAFTKSVIGADGAMAVLASGREVKYMQDVLSLWTQPVWCRLCRCLLAAASLCMLCRCLVAAVCLRHAVSLPHGRSPFGAGGVVALGRSQCGGSALRSAVRERMLRQRDPLRVVTLAWRERNCC